MIDKILRGIIGLLGLLLGYAIARGVVVNKILQLPNRQWLNLGFYSLVSVIFGIIFFILGPKLIRSGRKLIKYIDDELEKIPASDVALGSIGLIVGLIIATFFSQPFYELEIPLLGVIIAVVLYILFGYLGIKVSTRSRDGLVHTFEGLKKDTEKDKLKDPCKSCPKILDTSVIIDGRIADICKTGFIEGPLIIPEFVLDELQHIADSSDGLKRNRGRRGLDILNKIQKELDVEVIIHHKEFKDVKEVDSKLLKLTQLLKGKIITNDYNLNKVAEVQSIAVLNINELANAVKPVVLPGEEMVVKVVKDGKEAGQGLAYLDDGTMIVVESGKKYIGKTIDVLVTSVLQTSAGRMIFAKPKILVTK